MYRIGILSVAALLAVFAVGCAASGENSKTTAQAPTDTELAAYAARTKYPDLQPTDDLRVAALISPDRSSVKIYNFTNQPLPNVDVWVNKAWLQHVDGIGANGSVIIKTADLYNAFGKTFASQSEPLTKVQLKIGDHFYNTMGPVAQ